MNVYADWHLSQYNSIQYKCKHPGIILSENFALLGVGAAIVKCDNKSSTITFTHTHTSQHRLLYAGDYNEFEFDINLYECVTNSKSANICTRSAHIIQCLYKTLVFYISKIISGWVIVRVPSHPRTTLVCMCSRRSRCLEYFGWWPRRLPVLAQDFLDWATF